MALLRGFWFVLTTALLCTSQACRQSEVDDRMLPISGHVTAPQKRDYAIHTNQTSPTPVEAKGAKANLRGKAVAPTMHLTLPSVPDNSVFYSHATPFFAMRTGATFAGLGFERRMQRVGWSSA